MLSFYTQTEYIKMEKYLKATEAIDCDNESIKAKAQSLTRGQEGDIAKAKNLFYFVRDEIKYNPYVYGDRIEYYRASRTLEVGEGFCFPKAVLLAALARAVSIPARLYLTVIRNYLVPDKLSKLMGSDLFTHGYNELYIQGKWVKATPAFDSEMCQKSRIVPVEFDGENDAIFHSHNLDGELHIEYVEDYGHYDDMPFEEVLSSMLDLCGADYFQRLSCFINEERDGK